MRQILLILILFTIISCNNNNPNKMLEMTDRLDQLDKDELQIKVEKAKKEIDAENFSSAVSILDEAKNHATDKEDEDLLAETNTYYKNEKFAYDERIRKEKDRQKQLADLRKQEELNRSSYSSSNSSNIYNYQSGFCYKIKYKDTNPFHNKITYTIECGNRRSKSIKYNPDKSRPYGIMPMIGQPDYKYYSLKEAAQNACDCN